MFRDALQRIGQALGTAPAGGPSSETRLTAWGDWNTSTTETWSGKPVTPSSSLHHLTVYGCNRFICDGISTLPVDVFRRGTDGVAVKVPTPPVLEQPTTDLDTVSWLTQVLTSLLIAGNFYGYRVYSGGVTPISAVIPIDPTTVTVIMEKNRKVFVVNGVHHSTSEILHIPGVMFPGSLVGLSPIEAARQTIGAGMSAQEFGSKFFGQGTTLSGVIQVPGEMTPEQTKAMAAAWAKKHGSAANSHLPAVLQGGAEWKPTQLSNEQSQFLETRQFTASEIAAQLFLIDPAEMGLPVPGSSLTYTNQEQRNIRKVQVTFLPWIVRLEKAMSTLTPRGQYVKLNVSGLLRGDTAARFQAYATGIGNEFLVPNEARAFEDWAPLEGGDEVVKKTPPPEPVADASAEDAPMNDADRAAILDAIAAVDSRRDDARDAEHRADMVRALNALSERRQDPVVVNLPEIPVPEFRFEPPVVNVTVEPTPVTIEAPNVNVESPTINVESPAVTVTNDVQPSGVTLVNPPRTRTVERDPFGNIVKVVEE